MNKTFIHTFSVTKTLTSDEWKILKKQYTCFPIREKDSWHFAELKNMPDGIRMYVRKQYKDWRCRNMTINEVTKNHLSEYAKIYRLAFAEEPWDEDWEEENAKKVLIDIMDSHICVGYEVCEGENVVGAVFGMLFEMIDGKMLEIRQLFIDPQFQGRGFGSALLQQLEKDVLENHYLGLMLETVRDNKRVSFYQKNGYIKRTSGIYFKKSYEDIEGASTRESIGISQMTAERVRNRLVEYLDSEDLHYYINDSSTVFLSFSAEDTHFHVYIFFYPEDGGLRTLSILPFTPREESLNELMIFISRLNNRCHYGSWTFDEDEVTYREYLEVSGNSIITDEMLGETIFGAHTIVKQCIVSFDRLIRGEINADEAMNIILEAD